jgi:hypothetical protein
VAFKSLILRLVAEDAALPPDRRSRHPWATVRGERSEQVDSALSEVMRDLDRDPAS